MARPGVPASPYLDPAMLATVSKMLFVDVKGNHLGRGIYGYKPSHTTCDVCGTDCSEEPHRGSKSRLDPDRIWVIVACQDCWNYWKPPGYYASCADYCRWCWDFDSSCVIGVDFKLLGYSKTYDIYELKCLHCNRSFQPVTKYKQGLIEKQLP